MTAWRFAAGQATGSAHEKLGKPCQDRFACCVEEDKQTLIAAVSDGAGTAEHAHIGAEIAVNTVISIAQLGVRAEAWPPNAGWRMLVNATPVGTWPLVDETPLPADVLTGPLVYDLVYNPPVTRLMREAAARGARVIGGLEMFVGQACRQFEWWTGRPAPREVIEQAAAGWVTEEA